MKSCNNPILTFLWNHIGTSSNFHIPRILYFHRDGRYLAIRPNNTVSECSRDVSYFFFLSFCLQSSFVLSFFVSFFLCFYLSFCLSFCLPVFLLSFFLSIFLSFFLIVKLMLIIPRSRNFSLLFPLITLSAT